VPAATVSEVDVSKKNRARGCTCIPGYQKEVFNKKPSEASHLWGQMSGTGKEGRGISSQPGVGVIEPRTRRACKNRSGGEGKGKSQINESGALIYW